MTDYYEDTHDLTQEDIATFLEAMASGREIEAGSEIHRIMVAASERAMRITARMNSSFRSLSETRDAFEELLMKQLPDGVGLFPPFSTDCGINTHLGRNVFINAGCRFQDQGGIFIGDRTLIGHNAVITTINHCLDVERRANMVPQPVHIGSDVWFGANVTVLPGVSIGDGAVIAAGAVVAKDIPSRTVAAGVPAKVIKEL